MPDRWGRPTFQDGFSIAQGIQYLKDNQTAAQDRERRIAIEDEQRGIDKQTFVVADALNKGQGEADLSEYDPESVWKGSKLYWDQSLQDLNSQLKKQQLSNAGRQQKIQDITMQNMQAAGALKAYKAARASGDDEAAKTIARQINNDYVYNGKYVESEDGKLKVTNWDHSTESMEDLPIEKYDEMLGAYFSMDPKQVMQMSLGGEAFRTETNHKILSQAKPLYNPDTNKVIYMVPGGTWGKDGKPRGPFYVDNPVSQNEVSPEDAKSYMPLDQKKKKWVPTTKEEAIEFEKVKHPGKSDVETALSVLKTTKKKKPTITEKILAQDYDIPVTEEGYSTEEETIRAAAQRKIAEKMGVDLSADEKTSQKKADLPGELTEDMISGYMKHYPEKFKTREDVINAARALTK